MKRAVSLNWYYQLLIVGAVKVAATCCWLSFRELPRTVKSLSESSRYLAL